MTMVSWICLFATTSLVAGSVVLLDYASLYRVCSIRGAPVMKRVASQIFALFKRYVRALNRHVKPSKAVRRLCVLASLPEMLDVIILGLSAGLSFDASLALYFEHTSSETLESMYDAMQAWRMGISSRDEALQALARRFNIPAFDRIVAAIRESMLFGAPLVPRLETQAQALRDERQQSLEEEIEKLPVRMLIPLTTLLVPALFIAILGPLFSSSAFTG